VAADERLRVAAVVEFFGGLPREARGDLQGLPGAGLPPGQGPTVPGKEAENLRDLLADRGLPGKLQIYKGVGHVFRKGGQLQPAIAAAAEGQAVAFLEKHLKRGKRSARE
jgi:dienelactone hydrolase